MSEDEWQEVESMTDEEKRIMSRNIVAGEKILDDLIEMSVSHLRYTQANCPKACLGEDAGRSIEELNFDQLRLLLIQSVRRLAEQKVEV